MYVYVWRVGVCGAGILGVTVVAPGLARSHVSTRGSAVMKTRRISLALSQSRSHNPNDPSYYHVDVLCVMYVMYVMYVMCDV